MTRRRSHDERGSAAVEAVVGVPAFALFVGLIIFGGRSATTHQSVETAAADAARTASIERTAISARSKATSTATTSLSNQGIDCLDIDVTVDASQFSRPVGETATVSVTVQCRLDLSDLSVPGVPGSRLIKATQYQPDRHLERARMTRRTRDERGSISIWMVTASFVMMMLVGLAVDLGGQVHAKQRAHNIAAEAARTGGEQVEAGTRDRRALRQRRHHRRTHRGRAIPRCRRRRRDRHGNRRRHDPRCGHRHLHTHVLELHRHRRPHGHVRRLRPHSPQSGRNRTVTTRNRLAGLGASLLILLLVIGTPVLLIAIGATPWHERPR
ncbi:MAG: Tad domain-containing protein [Nocardioides sp.]